MGKELTRSLFEARLYKVLYTPLGRPGKGKGLELQRNCLEAAGLFLFGQNLNSSACLPSPPALWPGEFLLSRLLELEKPPSFPSSNQFHTIMQMAKQVQRERASSKSLNQTSSIQAMSIGLTMFYSPWLKM